MRIAMVALGHLPIPPQGYGGIEYVVWEYQRRMQARGHEVILFNGRKRHLVSGLLKMGKVDWIHVHHERAISRALIAGRLKRTPVVVTPHMDFVWSRMDKDESERFRMLGYAEHLLPMKQEMADRLHAQRPDAKIEILSHAVDVAQVRFSEKGNGRAVYLAAINRQKRQEFVAPLFVERGVPCDFIGPERGQSIDPLASHLGEWTRDEVKQRLTEYSAMVLWSEHEGGGPPLAVAEGLAAGLSVVLSPVAAANLDWSLPFIHIVERLEDLPLAVKSAIAENHVHRAAIRRYAEERFDWERVIDRYEAILTGWSAR